MNRDRFREICEQQGWTVDDVDLGDDVPPSPPAALALLKATGFPVRRRDLREAS